MMEFTPDMTTRINAKEGLQRRMAALL